MISELLNETYLNFSEVPKTPWGVQTLQVDHLIYALDDVLRGKKIYPFIYEKIHYLKHEELETLFEKNLKQIEKHVINSFYKQEYFKDTGENPSLQNIYELNLKPLCERYEIIQVSQSDNLMDLIKSTTSDFNYFENLIRLSKSR